MQHAKNIRNGFGVPIWFLTHDSNHQPVPFIHLVYQWSKHSFRVQDRLTCLLYTNIQAAVKASETISDWIQSRSIRNQSECRRQL